jgi:hypothetical protein
VGEPGLDMGGLTKVKYCNYVISKLSKPNLRECKIIASFLADNALV